ncbi:MAG: 30S ribosomal protein S13 [Nanoarchaeota archaeon]
MEDKTNKNSNQENYRHLVRVSSTDIDGAKTVLYALTKIKGVSIMLSNALLSVSGIPKDKKAGTLTEEDVSKLNDIIKNPLKHNIPEWLLNRRKDYETGENVHLVSAELDFTKDNDIKRLKKIKSNRGLRHAWKLPLRGQRTQSNFRRSKGKVTGVKRKK